MEEERENQDPEQLTAEPADGKDAVPSRGPSEKEKAGGPEDFKRHRQTHIGEKPNWCEEFGATFTRAFSLKKHQRIHTGEKPYSCEVCGKAFSQTFILTCHMRIHTGEEPFWCEECGKTFRYNNSLTTHLRKHHS